MNSLDVAVIVGSLRKESYSRKIAKALFALAPDSLKLEIVEIGDLPIYNQDLEADPPAAWVAFRERLAKADAFLFVTPEHNRSFPAALKNALDIGSRPPVKSIWSDKPGAIVSNSTGQFGGFGANHHLRQSLAYLNVFTMQQPEAYLGNVTNLLDDDGNLKDESTRKFLARFLISFADWADRTCCKRALV